MKKILLGFCLIATCGLLAFNSKETAAEIWNVITIAGWEEDNNTMDGLGHKAHFTWQTGQSAMDAADNYYVIDQICIRKMDPATQVTTLFGLGALDANGNSLSIPESPGQDGIVTDKDGNIYLSSARKHAVYRIKTDKTVERFAGEEGYKGKDDGPRLEAGLNNPTGLCIDKAGNIYVADAYNAMVRKISPDGNMTTLAGNGQIGDFTTGTGKNAQFQEVRAIAVDSKGNVFVAQNSGRGSCIAKISPAGVVTNFAGDINALLPSGVNHDGTGKAARFMRINALLVDKDDNLIIGEDTRIRRASPAGVVTTLAGNENSEWRDAAGAKAMFRKIAGISIDSKGNMLISDQYCIRKMTKQ